MSLYNHKYHIESTRLKHWDYSNSAPYFITICTKERIHFFGEVQNKIMHLNEIGAKAQEEWLKSPSIRPDMNLMLDAFIIMPNHIHAIIFICENRYNCRGDRMHCVSTNKNQFGPQSKNLGAIIRGFKSAVTIKARTINSFFGWQSLYHDHVIRNESSYNKIKNYIILPIGKRMIYNYKERRREASRLYNRYKNISFLNQ